MLVWLVIVKDKASQSLSIAFTLSCTCIFWTTGNGDMQVEARQTTIQGYFPTSAEQLQINLLSGHIKLVFLPTFLASL